MAMGAFASTRSLWLYMREGVIDKHRAVALAVGAAFGASIGVFLRNLDEAAPVAKILMGVTLWIVAVRFLWDVYTLRSTKLKA
jgi:uncharacterized membrane protein YfcA